MGGEPQSPELYPREEGAQPHGTSPDCYHFCVMETGLSQNWSAQESPCTQGSWDHICKVGPLCSKVTECLYLVQGLLFYRFQLSENTPLEKPRNIITLIIIPMTT